MLRRIFRGSVCLATTVAVLQILGCGGDDDDAAAPSTPLPAGGAGSGGAGGGPGPEATRYDDTALWLCHPGKDAASDQCRANDLSVTDILPDGTFAPQPAPAVAEAPAFDCFYIYPTVDLAFAAGNHEDVTKDWELALDPLLLQVAPFRSMCRIFAPLYRQATIGSYGDEKAEEYLEYAYKDVEEAFRHYTSGQIGDRRFVLMGHSQGSHMARRLLQRVIEPDAALHGKLIAAVLIGGDVAVPEGQTVGGSFQKTPLCTSDAETGCVLAYRSFADEMPPKQGAQTDAYEKGPADGPKRDVACTNPGALGGGKSLYARSVFPVKSRQPLFNPDTTIPAAITTPYVAYPNFYSGECKKDLEGLSFLAISITPGAGDTRTNQIPFDYFLFSPSGLGLHLLDYSFPLEELLHLVETKAAKPLQASWPALEPAPAPAPELAPAPAPELAPAPALELAPAAINTLSLRERARGEGKLAPAPSLTRAHGPICCAFPARIPVSHSGTVTPPTSTV
jgi:hypothetical protein